MQISKYVTYNYWAIEKLTSWLKTLESELLYKTTKSSFDSIDLTLQHMKNAQNFWYAVITEQDIKNLDETIKQNSFEVSVEKLLDSSQKMISTYNAFTDQQLMAKVASPVMTKSRNNFIVHVINHNSYHRGQIVTMARSFGIVSNIPETDYETFLWSDDTV